MKRTRLVLVGLCILLAALLCLGVQRGPGPPTEPSVPNGERPRGESRGGALPRSAGLTPDVSTEPVRARLHLWTYRFDRLHYHLEVSGAPLESVVPSDPSSWDTSLLETSAFARTWRTGWNPYRTPHQLQEVLDAGRAEPLPDDTPEGRWQTLYASWMEASTTRQAALHDYVHRHFGPDATWETLTSTQRRDTLQVEPLPRFDATGMIDAVDRTYQDFPDHPVLDHARLIESVAVLPRFRAEEPVGSDWVEVFDSIEDEGLRAFALTDMVAATTWHAVDAEVLDAALAVDDLPVNIQARVLTWVAHQSAKTHSLSHGIEAERRLRAVLADYCNTVREDQCVRTQTFARDLTGRLAAIGKAEPRTWQDALTAEAWACELAGHRHIGIAETTVSWRDGAWHWGAWSRETAATACLSGVTVTEPAPPEPIVVDIVYEYGR